MRIAGGEFGGINLKAPKSDLIRPTQDRVREALFNIIQCEVTGCDFLDLFAGSGAVGIEALSRGAAHATFVELNRRHAVVLNENLQTILKSPRAQTQATVITADSYCWLAAYSGPGFGVVFADPPYALGEERGYPDVLATLKQRGVVKPEGLFVAEMTVAQRAETIPGWELLRDRVYGKTRICIWRNLSPMPENG